MLEPSRSPRPRDTAGTLDKAIVTREPGTEDGRELRVEAIALFGAAMDEDGTLRVGVLTTDSVVKVRVLRNLKNESGTDNLVLQAATDASLREAVDAGFLLGFLPISMANGFCRAPLSNTSPPLWTTYGLNSGPRFAANIADGVISPKKILNGLSTAQRRSTTVPQNREHH